MTRLPLLAFALVFLALPAQAQPTPEQRQACEQDAYRFCNDAIPDEQRVRQCLAKNVRRLNPVCRSAFQRRGKRR